MLDAERIAAQVASRHRRSPAHLLQILVEIQDAVGHLPREVLARVARMLELPFAQVRGVAEFYAFLCLEPAGHYRFLFPDNITDRMAGTPALMRRLCELLAVPEEEVSPGGCASVARTSCAGMCDQGPSLLVNGRAITRLDEGRIGQIADLVRAGRALDEWPADFFTVVDHIGRRDALLGDEFASGAALVLATRLGRTPWLEAMRAASLRGRGGAGFATAVKWAACRDARGSDKVVVCNADEGEPGTFKDRVLLSTRAHLVFEGMTLAAWATGARQGFLYLRGEYRYLRRQLEDALALRRAAGLLGGGILGDADFDFDIEIHLGAGAYVCGEETALLESLEGRRGTPRLRPPFPVDAGYLGRPTVVNNVETYAHAAWIALHGAAEFARRGTLQSRGTKLLSLSGDCSRPGVYEYPFGVSVAEVLAACGGERAAFVQVGGPSGVMLTRSEFARRIAFEDVPCAGGVMVFDESRDPFEVARNFVEFFAHESCGFCTPCRVGTSLLKAYMDKLAAGQGAKADLADIEWIDRILKHGSHCGLGASAPNVVLDTLAKFRPAYERRLHSLEFMPGFDLDGALATARRLTGRDDPGAHLAPSEGKSG